MKIQRPQAAPAATDLTIVVEKTVRPTLLESKVADLFEFVRIAPLVAIRVIDAHVFVRIAVKLLLIFDRVHRLTV